MFTVHTLIYEKLTYKKSQVIKKILGPEHNGSCSINTNAVFQNIKAKFKIQNTKHSLKYDHLS